MENAFNKIDEFNLDLSCAHRIGTRTRTRRQYCLQRHPFKIQSREKKNHHEISMKRDGD